MYSGVLYNAVSARRELKQDDADIFQTAICWKIHW